jgi:hypothetical protein
MLPTDIEIFTCIQAQTLKKWCQRIISIEGLLWIREYIRGMRALRAVDHIRQAGKDLGSL